MAENKEEVYTEEGMLQSVQAIEHIERASIDIQISTAHQYPRSIQLFQERSLSMVTLDMETAQSCIYRRPVGKERGKPIYAEGKSVRMAEIVGTCYGNLRVGSMIVELEDRYVKARGMAHDLESNFAASTEVIESFVKRDGTLYSERMKIVVAKAALAKARRDATFQVVPGALCKTLEDAARKTAIGTTKTLGKRRSTVMDWINKTGIDKERIFNALNISGIEDLGLKELETLTGLRTAIKDGDTTIDEAFLREEIKMPTPKGPIDKVETAPANEKAHKEIENEYIGDPGRFTQWAELDEEEIKSVLNALRGHYKSCKERMAAQGFDNIGKVLAHFEVKSLSPTDMSPEQYWRIYDHIIEDNEKVKI